MNLNIVVPGLCTLFSLAMAVAVADQWRARRRRYQLAWAIGMLMYALAAGTEVAGEAFGWSEGLYKTWYLTGAVWVAAWLGLGTVFLLARTRFGYAFAGSLFLAGLFTYLTQQKESYPDASPWQWIYLAAAIVLAVAIGWLTYRGSERWADVAAAAIGGGTLLSLVMMALAPLPAPGFVLDAGTRIPDPRLLPGYVRLLTPFLNIAGAFALVLGAAYSAYIFMPKRRVVAYSLRRAGTTGGEFLRNLAISPVAIAVNFLASLPGAVAALLAGRLHSRVAATILIAIAGFIPSVTTGLVRFGNTSSFYFGQLLGALLLLAGFLVSIEVFGEFHVPFTRWRSGPRHERAAEVAGGRSAG